MENEEGRSTPHFKSQANWPGHQYLVWAPTQGYGDLGRGDLIPVGKATPLGYSQPKITVSGPPGWGFCCGLETHPSKSYLLVIHTGTAKWMTDWQGFKQG